MTEKQDAMQTQTQTAEELAEQLDGMHPEPQEPADAGDEPAPTADEPAADGATPEAASDDAAEEGDHVEADSDELTEEDLDVSIPVKLADGTTETVTLRQLMAERVTSQADIRPKWLEKTQGLAKDRQQIEAERVKIAQERQEMQTVRHQVAELREEIASDPVGIASEIIRASGLPNAEVLAQNLLTAAATAPHEGGLGYNRQQQQANLYQQRMEQMQAQMREQQELQQAQQFASALGVHALPVQAKKNLEMILAHHQVTQGGRVSQEQMQAYVDQAKSMAGVTQQSPSKPAPTNKPSLAHRLRTKAKINTGDRPGGSTAGTTKTLKSAQELADDLTRMGRSRNKG